MAKIVVKCVNHNVISKLTSPKLIHIIYKSSLNNYNNSKFDL